MHHVLIQSGHGYHGKCSGKELLEEVLLAVDIIKEKYAGHIAVGNCTEHTGERQIKVGSYIADAQYNRYHKAERFQGVRPDERLYASTESVQPYQSYGDGYIQNKR